MTTRSWSSLSSGNVSITFFVNFVFAIFRAIFRERLKKASFDFVNRDLQQKYFLKTFRLQKFYISGPKWCFKRTDREQRFECKSRHPIES